MENSAWLLKDLNGDYFSVCDVEMVEYIPTASIYSVPLTPFYCKHVMAWREQLIPIVDIALLFNATRNNDFEKVGIFAYQPIEDAPLNHIAIPLHESPLHITVNDSQHCDLPSRFTDDTFGLALSSFSYQEQAVPILSINYLCSIELRDCVMSKTRTETEKGLVLNI